MKYRVEFFIFMSECAEYIPHFPGSTSLGSYQVREHPVQRLGILGHLLESFYPLTYFAPTPLLGPCPFLVWNYWKRLDPRVQLGDVWGSS